MVLPAIADAFISGVDTRIVTGVVGTLVSYVSTVRGAIINEPQATWEEWADDATPLGTDFAPDPTKGNYAMPVTQPTMHPGMDLRDWFAGQCVAGLLAQPAYVRGAGVSDSLAETKWHPPTDAVPAEVADFCYSLADALVAERNA